MSRKFEDYDYVGFYTEGSDEMEYGVIQKYSRAKKMYEIACYSRRENIWLPKEALTYMPPKILTADDMRRLLRYECTYAEISADIVPKENYRLEEYELEYCFDDMETMIKNLAAARPDEEEFRNWLFMAFSDEYELYCSEKRTLDFTTVDKDLTGEYSVVHDTEFAEKIFGVFWNVCMDNIWSYAHSSDLRTEIDIDYISRDLDNFRNGQAVKSHMWSLAGKKRVCELLSRNTLKTDLLSDEINDVRSIVTDLASADDPLALEALGYACYGGDNPVFECSWETAKDCFLKLYSMDNADDLKKCYWANTLGYIFYYGRCNNGVPEYEKALKYFTVGAAGGIYESMYKLADMYSNGYGTKKNKRAAECLVSKVYEDNLELMMKEKFDCKFADAALRMGNLCRDEIMEGDEYYYYTLADFAVRKRAAFNHYGDSKVFMGIQKELVRIRETRPLKKASKITEQSMPDVVKQLFKGYSCWVTIRHVSGGISINITRHRNPGCRSAEKIFECYPDYGYCRLIDSRTIKALDAGHCSYDQDVSFMADDIREEFSCKHNFNIVTIRHHDELVYTFSTTKYSYPLLKKSEKELTEHTIASVSFSAGGRTYDYICSIPDVKAGDKVIVFANGEEKEVEVQRIFKMQMGDMPLELGKYKEVLRKV